MKQADPGYRVRRLAKEDLSSLRSLFNAIVDEGAYRRAPGEYPDDEAFAKWNVRVLENPTNVYLVAVTDVGDQEVVIGFIRFLQNVSRRRTRHQGSFTIGVDANFRSKGVGQALLDALLGELEATEIERVSLQVFQDNQGALRFYERNGFIASGALPGEIKMKDGRYRDLTLMHRWIK